MTKRKQTRNNDYYVERLKRDHPNIYADLQAGKFKNTTQAIVEAGLKKPRSALDTLESIWKQATPAERNAFKIAIGCTVAPPAAPTPAVSPVAVSMNIARPLRANTHLSSQTTDRIEGIMHLRKMKMGEVMKEMGFSSLNTSLGMAMQRGTQVREDVFKALEEWLETNKNVRR